MKTDFTTAPHALALSTGRRAAPWKSLRAPHTKILTLPPRLAAARMLGTSFPFSKWAASIKHEPAAGGHSVLIYTYNIEAGPRMLRWLIEPVVHHIFRRQTVKRFERMRAFLSSNANEVETWQRVHHSVGSTDAQ